MRRRSQEIVMPRRLLSVVPPVPPPVKQAGDLAFRAAVLVVCLLIGFALARRAFPEDTCCADASAATSSEAR